MEFAPALLSDHGFSDYVQRVCAIPLLEPEEENQLIKRWCVIYLAIFYNLFMQDQPEASHLPLGQNKKQKDALQIQVLAWHFFLLVLTATHNFYCY